MKKLTKAQENLLKRFPKDKWVDAYTVKASMATLSALEKFGYLESRGWGTLGSIYSPRTTVEYRLIQSKIF